MNDIRNIAVILAGGSGQRFGAELPKQFLLLAGKTVIEHSVEAFERCEAIDEIAVVMHPDHIDAMQRIIDRNGWSKVRKLLPGGAERYRIIDRNGWSKVRKLLPGGAERYLSTLAAINAYRDLDDVNLILHDAARPAVSQRIVNDVVTALQTHSAVAVAIPATDTVFEISDDGTTITAIPDRKRLRNAQTPQAFRLDILQDAYNKALKDNDFTCTDDCGVLLRYRPDIPIHLISGDITNRKLTYPEDTTLLEKTLTLNP